MKIALNHLSRSGEEVYCSTKHLPNSHYDKLVIVIAYMQGAVFFIILRHSNKLRSYLGCNFFKNTMAIDRQLYCSFQCKVTEMSQFTGTFL